eukprot:2492079-Rhodomonas_salina.2
MYGSGTGPICTENDDLEIVDRLQTVIPIQRSSGGTCPPNLPAPRGLYAFRNLHWKYKINVECKH